MELDWRERRVAGERLEDLLAVVERVGPQDASEFYVHLWDDVASALPFHRAMMRVLCEMLSELTVRLSPENVIAAADGGQVIYHAYIQVIERAGRELERAGLWSPARQR